MNSQPSPAWILRICLFIFISTFMYDLGARTFNFGQEEDRYITMQETGIKVHYKLIGDGPVNVIFVPGWTNPLEVYSKQFDYFSKRAKCIYIDLPGHGSSDAPDDIEYTMELMADAIYEVAKKEGFKKFIGVGFSMGPVPLAMLERKHPGMITRFINIDGGFTPWPAEGDSTRKIFLEQIDAAHMDMMTWTREQKMQMVSMLVPETAPDDLKELTQYFIDYPSWLMANISRNMMAEKANQPIEWKVPILCIYTHPVMSMDYHNLYFPNSIIKVFEGSGHVVQWEKSKEVNRLLDDFIYDRPELKDKE